MNQGINLSGLKLPEGVKMKNHVTTTKSVQSLLYVNLSQKAGEIVYTLPEALKATPEQLEEVVGILKPIFEQNLEYSTDTLP
jgi:hypothetical protein